MSNRFKIHVSLLTPVTAAVVLQVYFHQAVRLNDADRQYVHVQRSEMLETKCIISNFTTLTVTESEWT